MNITRTSILTGITRVLDLPITSEQLANYASGALLQEAFPNLSPSDREFIKTGITASEWEAMFGGFGGDEEEENEPLCYEL